MSNGRKPATHAQAYRRGYLHSTAWHCRRDRWITTELDKAGQLRCTVCQGGVERRRVEIHHLSYHGVTRTAGGWVAGEAHEDLVCAHRRCHEWLHHLLDSDAALRRMSDRRAANAIATARLRARLRRVVGELQSGERR